MSRKEEVNARLSSRSAPKANLRSRTPLEDDPRARRIAAMDAGPEQGKSLPSVNTLPTSATLADVITALNVLIERDRNA